MMQQKNRILIALLVAEQRGTKRKLLWWGDESEDVKALSSLGGVEFNEKLFNNNNNSTGHNK